MGVDKKGCVWEEVVYTYCKVGGSGKYRIELIVGFDRPASRAKFVARLEDKPEDVSATRRGRSRRAVAEFCAA